jgi:hypothetical protein
MRVYTLSETFVLRCTDIYWDTRIIVYLDIYDWPKVYLSIYGDMLLAHRICRDILSISWDIWFPRFSCQRKFYFNLLHWAWTAEPDRGSHAESLASAAAGSGYAKLIFKQTAVYAWIFNLAIFHFIVATVFASWFTIFVLEDDCQKNCSSGGQAVIFDMIQNL